ncbi:putative membrane protein YkoI [Bradyrhizobium japonicum]|jgi:uncharacterized membrane protein YkoI|uniref:Membrane protein YkoI n=1 Tax=Bradyrhizobium elkanii TaxID=29448 RepID=A0ABV4FC61_BRAEL|nr:PepSY domain-containing protein [Bradyrhizobium elkanii]MBP2431829.1 putative membrane protein YkoI [Bradyrhizobium elkanii]MCP1735100.1 putative membrane protein YkoI [Bradyrhizobium elkanii]MCP1752642.1 putative membrane protein YkoI [Bradyrhizobium elkanii]MCP1978415.1 putative membrane protein YkoI [Bradyrhizobium elkanii]MCS3570440.1 putative membrane protein YkoI [Bradyrhizobium elkanii]
MRLHHPFTVARIALLLVTFASTAAPTVARDDDPKRRDAVRRAVEAGEVLPLSQILERVRGKVPGDITGIEINREEGRWLYEFRVIDRGGRVLEVHVDARSGNIEQIEEK